MRDKRILITGGYGFLGSYVVDIFRERKHEIIDVVLEKPALSPGVYLTKSIDHDLTKELVIGKLFYSIQPDIIIHLAAVVGGIGINKRKPGTFYYQNLIMGSYLLEHARINKIEKFVTVGSVCAYPKFTPVPFKEEDLWNGFPEESNAPYGLAKKALLVQSQAYRQEFGLNAIYLIPVNLYGPRDNFRPDSSHCIPAIVKKCVEAKGKLSEITLWGTGNATREFIHAKDAARAIVAATESYDEPDPINIGTGQEISIKDLANKIAEIIGYAGEIKWDASAPGGQPRRLLDVTKAKEKFGFEAKIDFDIGLRQTIEWYTGKISNIVF